MFHYNHDTSTIEDAERGLIVRQGTGPGQGVYAGDMVSKNWKLYFLVTTEDNSVSFTQGRKVDNRDYSVNLHISVWPVEGEYDRPESPFELAKEAAIAREVGFFKTDPSRITVNTPT